MNEQIFMDNLKELMNPEHWSAYMCGADTPVGFVQMPCGRKAEVQLIITTDEDEWKGDSNQIELEF